MTDPNCIFCKIIQRSIPAAVVYEDEHVLSFLDIAPARPGHALVIPKAHHPTLLDLPLELAQPLLTAAQRIGRAVMGATGAGGLNIVVNTYRDAGQLVDHAHLHLIPRHAGDGLAAWPQGSYPSPQDMAAMAQNIRQKLNP